MSLNNMHDAKTNLSRLVQAALDGEEVIIARGNQPLVRLVPIEKPVAKGRNLGWGKGFVLHMAEDFDAPLDDFKDHMQ